MKVYEIRSGSPANKRYTDYASLSPKNKDGSFISSKIGEGVPCQNWKELELYVYDPANPKPDIFAMGLNRVLSPNAYSHVGGVLAKSGQLLPLTIRGQLGEHFLYNCTSVVDALNPDGSIWTHYKELNDARIDVPAFHADRLKGVTVFMLPRERRVGGVFVVERSTDLKEGEFKALVDHYGLTGLRFDLLWSEDIGPANPAFIYDKNSPLEHRKADGSPWIYRKPEESLAGSIKAPHNPRPRHRK